MSLAILIFLFFYLRPHAQYLFDFMPIASVVAATFLMNLKNNFRTGFLIFLVSISVYKTSLLLISSNNTAQLKKINYVISVTNANDYVYDGDIQFNLFRKDIDYFWFSLRPGRGLTTYQKLVDYKYDLEAAILKLRPRVVADYLLTSEMKQRLSTLYHPTAEFPDLWIRN